MTIKKIRKKQKNFKKIQGGQGICWVAILYTPVSIPFRQ